MPAPGEPPSPRPAREWEGRLLAIPSPDNVRESVRRLSARPHHVGSPTAGDNAEWILARFREWGWDAEIETFDVPLPDAEGAARRDGRARRFRLALEEPAVVRRPHERPEGRAASDVQRVRRRGRREAQVVYVNYGTPEDYKELDKMGISVKGKIAIARYGRSWRGIKPKVAPSTARSAASSTRIPATTATSRETCFPRGLIRPKHGVQRGSVMDMPVSPRATR